MAANIQRVGVDQEKLSKKGQPMIEMKFEVLDEGEYKNFPVYRVFMIEHENPKVIEYSMRALSALSKSAGVPNWTMCQQLEWNFVSAGIEHDKDRGTQKTNIRILNFSPYVIYRPSALKTETKDTRNLVTATNVGYKYTSPAFASTSSQHVLQQNMKEGDSPF